MNVTSARVDALPFIEEGLKIQPENPKLLNIKGMIIVRTKPERATDGLELMRRAA